MDDKAVLTLPVEWHGPDRPKRTTGLVVDDETPAKPRKIIELDDTPQDKWRIEPEALHLWQGHLWSWDEVGCTECIDEDDKRRAEHMEQDPETPYQSADSVTLCRKDDDGNEHFHCLKHGKLDFISCTARKEFTITVGGEVIEGQVDHQDAFLVPASQTEEERQAYVKRLAGELASFQEKEGAFPSESDLSDEE